MSKTIKRGIQSVRADINHNDIKATVDALNTAFAAFKTEHTKQLDDVSARLRAT